MLKRTALRYIEYYEGTVHIAIMAASLINNFMVRDRYTYCPAVSQIWVFTLVWLSISTILEENSTATVGITWLGAFYLMKQ
jgi:hypothetical protein